MYKQKLLFFGLITALIILLALTSAAISAHLTRQNLHQSTIAQTLLIEHQQLSSTSYRLFKQLTDEVIFGQNANQSIVRNKQQLINQSIERIKQLELEQRAALGASDTHGSIEDTDKLEQLIQTIISDFNRVLSSKDTSPLNEQEALRNLLEGTIDNEFREAINDAVTRQNRVVVSLNARISTLNMAMFWFTIVLGLLSLPIVIYGCYWLFNQLYQPLILINNATAAIASGDYQKPISQELDDEFQVLASTINQLAEQLKEHELSEASSKQQLQIEVENRTRELMQANLKLTKIDSRRRQFISDVSHELRTPLTIIRGEAQVTLRQSSANESDYKMTLDAILEQAVMLSRLVDDLLFLTRAEMNQMHLELKPSAIVMLLTAEVSKWQRLHQDRQIILDYPQELAELMVVMDVSRIKQVLSILLDNAIKYSASSEPIQINLIQQEKVAKISVKDSGSGISAAEIENVFERFVRFSKHAEGLGLGLPIAKAIIDAHAGEISVESNQGEGSIFSISLPMAKPQ